MKKTLLFFLASMLSLGAFALTSITTKNIKGGPFCSGQTFTVQFTISGGPATVGNVFNAEMSDADGLFTAPVVIGSVTGNLAAPIPCTIPLGTASSSKYRIRVVSTLPAVIGSVARNRVSVDPPLQNVYLSDTTSTTMKLNWNSLGSNFSYKVRYRPVGQTGWGQGPFTQVGSATSYVFTGLMSSTAYEFQVSASCYDYSAGWVSAFGTTYAAIRIGNLAGDALQIIPTGNGKQFRLVYPVIGSNSADLKVFSAIGNQVKGNILHVQAGMNEAQLSMSDMASGIYIVQLNVDGRRFTRKITIQD